MVRVPFDVEDGRLCVFRLVAQAVHDQAAAHRAVRAGVAGLGTAGQLELAHLRQRIVWRKAQHGNTGASQSGSTNLEKRSSCHPHFHTSLVSLSNSRGKAIHHRLTGQYDYATEISMLDSHNP